MAAGSIPHRHSPVTAMPKRTPRSACRAIITGLSLAGLLLSACSGSSALECNSRDSRTYAAVIAPIVNHFDSVENRAREADAVERADYIVQLESIRDEAALVDVPACAEGNRGFLIERMDITIEGLFLETPTPSPTVDVTLTPLPTLTATPLIPTVTATPPPSPTSGTPTPTGTATPSPSPEATDSPTLTPTLNSTATRDPNITARVESVWNCEWVFGNTFEWYEAEVTYDQLTPIGEEVLDGPFRGPWRTGCPTLTPTPTSTPLTPTAQSGN